MSSSRLLPSLNQTGVVFATYILLGAGSQSQYLAAMKIGTGCWIATAIFNSMLSMLTGGRIWWISREARQHIGRSPHTKHKAIVAVIVHQMVSIHFIERETQHEVEAGSCISRETVCIPSCPRTEAGEVNREAGESEVEE
ncbi:hypothetical protein PM082_019748 [Marasmius tenuissimus]|nr:hypothetical protein PM082_019748 [Marasmius tenuissimus]